MDEKIREAMLRQVDREPFARKFGLRLAELGEGCCRVEMTFTPDMENMFGAAHGGALFALIDEAFEIASNSHGVMSVALNMNISYVAPPSAGAVLSARAREVNRTEKTAVYDITVEEEAGCLIASCRALVYRMGRPLPFVDKNDETALD